MMTQKSSTWFEISNQGWKRMNAGRTIGHLTREAISNVFDAEGVTTCIVTMLPGQITVEDDAPGGITDKSLVTTVFMTDKEDDATKRGRKGRGLKELIAAGTHAIVETVGYTVQFNADGTREDLPVSERTRGTRVSVYNEEWQGDALGEGIVYLRRFIPPETVKMTINGTPVRPSTVRESFKGYLRTTTIKDGKQIEEYRMSTVHIRNLRKGERKGWVYEMGVPVQEIGTKFDVDVQQRIPMNDNRDVVNAGYLPALYGEIIENMIEDLPKAELKEKWVLDGLVYVGQSIKEKYARRLLPPKSVIRSGNSRANDKAKQNGYELIDISNMPSEARSAIRDVIQDAEQVAQEIEDSTDITQRDDLRGEYSLTVRMLEWLAHTVTGQRHKITFMERSKSFTGTQAEADYSAATNTLRFNILATSIPLGQPLSPRVLEIFVHELAHRERAEHDEMFLREVERLAGALAATMVTHYDEIQRILGGTSVAAVATTAKATKLVEVHCHWPGCNEIRMVKPQDVFQVKYCVPHQKQAAKDRARRRRAGETDAREE